VTLFFFENHETDVPPTPQKARPQDWISCPHGHEGWSQSNQVPSSQGSQAADGRLINLLSTASFSASFTGPAMAVSMRFRAEQHLRRASDIRAVREHGRRIDCQAFTLWWKRREAVPAPAEIASKSSATRSILHARVCVVASTAAVGIAVRRNRAKRRLREVFRHQQHVVPADCDLMLIARAAATNWPMTALEKKFTEACQRIATASAANPQS
jgi:ribonuclease P protein component